MLHLIIIILKFIKYVVYYLNIYPNNEKEITTDYNIFIDIVSEKIYELCPSKYSKET